MFDDSPLLHDMQEFYWLSHVPTLSQTNRECVYFIYVPIFKTFPNTLKSRGTVEQFHLSFFICCWHSSIPSLAPFPMLIKTLGFLRHSSKLGRPAAWLQMALEPSWNTCEMNLYWKNKQLNNLKICVFTTTTTLLKLIFCVYVRESQSVQEKVNEKKIFYHQREAVLIGNKPRRRLKTTIVTMLLIFGSPLLYFCSFAHLTLLLWMVQRCNLRRMNVAKFRSNIRQQCQTAEAYQRKLPREVFLDAPSLKLLF